MTTTSSGAQGNRIGSAIVTGGGRGIGQATAVALADAGYAVTVIARSHAQLEGTVSLITERGGRALAVAADVGDSVGITDAVKAAEAQFGHCEVLANIAAINGPVALTADIDPSEWDDLVRINLTGTFLMCRAVLPGMIELGRGRILNTISGLATRVQPGLAAYSASKAAVAHYSAVLDAEYADKGIHTFAVNPGIVRTALTDELVGLAGDSVAQDSIVSRMTSDTVREMMVEPETSAALYRRLAAGEHTDRSGQIVSVYDKSLVPL
ncbi:hypothetical protein CH272_28010 [Rhodococcus sp. 05-340-1]|uniref:SDR family NAD(P)-dependent oxidoreductase n=1 Tax=unclassified Rhodococcus (in: high G+C Gram-positive bacteria) TaxID=192944 RepID=UPI000B9C669B|nr:MULTISPECIES: SDR family oxidoreductase [unclassified Rhodococcus (in: high G+C Gram-positive bacteria)]OZD68860.1 hypothetical protein CH271_10730 [Rhodococcus sp. 05-340-2]OZD69333.1 hypothetical protein CH272_28010 [Rhodococcus sp. 05-340-1]